MSFVAQRNIIWMHNQLQVDAILCIDKFYEWHFQYI